MTVGSFERHIDSIIHSQAMESSMLERDRELYLARAWRDDKNIAARNELVESHRKLVLGMAKNFKRSGKTIPFSDLFHEGMIALMVACEKFDPESGNRFSTYAQWWVLNYMQEIIQRDSCPVRIGKTRVEKAVFRALVRARRVHGLDLPYEIKEKIAEKFEITVLDVDKIDAATGIKSFSLNDTMNSEEETTEFIDTLVDESQSLDFMMQTSLNRSHNDILSEVLSLLDDREALIIRERFLLEEGKTLKDLAIALSISAERVRQIERESLEKLKKFIERRGISLQDLVGDL